jgi:hypothetical protein
MPGPSRISVPELLVNFCCVIGALDKPNKGSRIADIETSQARAVQFGAAARDKSDPRNN